eukprot:Seg311.5 transcript_id=Seg311.5/GoldUCD/mRNA.D3Y31 product="KICSTOR complex protein kaptin" protein_id=Seg311.5/GoldUCD/D3Y31
MAFTARPTRHRIKSNSSDEQGPTLDTCPAVSFLYREIFYLGLESQSNVYCCTKLEKSLTDDEKLLVGSLRGTVFCIDYKNESVNSDYRPIANKVYFTYIPGDAEIISMDSFSRLECNGSTIKNESMVIAVSLVLVKVIDGIKRHQHFLNVYKAMEPEQQSNLADIARSCQHIELYFTPYQLSHAHIFCDNDEKEKVFLLSGSDKKVHLFKEIKDEQRFEELPCEQFFPEFENLPSSVIWMDIKDCRDNIRVTAFGCQNGFIKVAVMDESLVMLKCFTMDVGGLVTSVRLFQLGHLNSKQSDDCGQATDLVRSAHALPDCQELSLLVTCAMELSVVYLNVCNQGFASMAVLPQSDHYDSVTCSLIADIDLDGENELLLGTYGQELLSYKSYHSSLQDDKVSVHFDLHWSKSFSKPIFAIETVDLTNNGLRELAVVSLNGVHILQFDVDQAAEIMLQKITTRQNEAEECGRQREEPQDQIAMSPIFEEITG